MQPLGPDDPLWECGFVDCDRDATRITRMSFGGVERALTACDTHLAALGTVVEQLREDPEYDGP